MLEPLTIKERVQVLYNSLIERAQKDEAFSEVFRENRNNLVSALNAIVTAIDEPDLNSDASELQNEEKLKLKLEIRQTLNKTGLTFVNKFDFGELMHIEQYPGLYFIFSQLKDNKIHIKCEFSGLDLYESYCKYFDDTTYVEFDLSYGSADVKVVSKIESSLENLAENTIKVAEKVKNLAQVFDTEDELNRGN